MAKPRFKGKRSTSGRHVQLPEYLLATDAWSWMKPGPRALYIEIKRRYNGKNNGQIWLSHRDAAKALSISKNTVGGYFDTLQERGFIHQTRGGYLGPDGCGMAALWALDEERTHDGQPAKKRFLRWQKQKPVPIVGIKCPGVGDT